MSNTLQTENSNIEPSHWLLQRANLLAIPLVCLSVTGCFGPGSSKAYSSSSMRPSVASSPSMAAPTPLETLSETAAPGVTVTESPNSMTTNTNPQRDGLTGLAGCKRYFNLSKYRNHEYEACTAYVSNASTVALGGLYKFGNNRIGYLSGAARHHFETRYWGDARQMIESRVDDWPKVSNLTGNRVHMNLSVLSLSSNLKKDRALLQTQEAAMVTEKHGQVIYDEASQTKDVTLCRGTLPGHPLHEWFVVSYSREPDFNCVGFDKANGLKP